MSRPDTDHYFQKVSSKAPSTHKEGGAFLLLTLGLEPLSLKKVTNKDSTPSQLRLSGCFHWFQDLFELLKMIWDERYASRCGFFRPSYTGGGGDIDIHRALSGRDGSPCRAVAILEMTVFTSK